MNTRILTLGLLVCLAVGQCYSYAAYASSGSFAGASSSAGANAGGPAYPAFGNRNDFASAPSGPGGLGNAAYPGVNTGPYSTNQAEFQAFIQEQLRQLQAQQEAFQAQIEAQRQIFLEMSNRIGSGGGFPQYPSQYPSGFQGGYSPQFTGGFPQYGGSQGGSYGSGPHSAVASASLGPQGGFQSGEISPASPGIQSRFNEPLPAPSGGGSYGVFSSSSSSHSVGPDGKEKSFKSATTGVNDNGKVSYHTVHDP